MRHINLVAFLLLGVFSACKTTQPQQGAPMYDVSAPIVTEMRVPDWAKNATIYELNVRQFSKEGSFAKATEALPRIKDLGVDIIWLMPIYPVATTNRKCDANSTLKCLGSPYAATDFKAVNPDFGSKEDFRAFVQKAHSLGLKVILDFVPDHTGWDSKWMKEHPEYFVQINGKMTAPIDPISKQPTDWTDVAMLNYNNPALRKAVIDAHEYWVREFEVDGFREDVAGFVPNDFWAELRVALDKIKPVFMLSEWGDIPAHLTSCFQMNYGWAFHALIKDIAKGKKNANDLQRYFTEYKPKFPKQGYQMHFTQNHDENTWNGTERESFGVAGNTFTALAFTIDGMGLIYNGQEVSLDKRLSLFNKDEIDWTGTSRVAFFQKLNALKKANKALWNGLAGGEMQRLPTSNDTQVFAFVREKEGDKVLGVYNLSDKAQTVTVKGSGYAGVYKNVMQGGNFEAKADMTLTLGAWDYLILSNK